MQLTPVGEYGFMLTHEGNYNAFLVRQDDRLTLIDTTMPGTADAILAELNRLHHKSRLRLSEILITHAHLDHVGSLDAITDNLQSRPLVYASKREARLLTIPADKSVDANEAQVEPKGKFPGILYRPTEFLSDGDRVGALLCIATPGHTPGHISFFDERDETLYAGDTLITHGGKAHVCGFGPSDFLGPARGTWNALLARSSVEKFAGLAVQRVASGHGPCLEGEDLIALALEEAFSTAPLAI